MRLPGGSRGGWPPTVAEKLAEKLATSISAGRILVPMASGADRMRVRRQTGRQPRLLAVETDRIRQLLPWWSKLVHQMLLAEDTGRSESEERDEREGEYVASAAPRMRVRSAVDGGSSVRARRVD